MSSYLHLRMFLMEKIFLSLHVPDPSVLTVVYALRIEKKSEGEILSLSASSSLSLGGNFFLRLFAYVSYAVLFFMYMDICNPSFVWPFGTLYIFL